MPKVVPYKRGSVIFFSEDKKDDRIFILQSGNVVLKWTDLASGKEIVENLQQGEFFGVKSSLAKMPRMETAYAMEDSQVIQLTPLEFENIFSKNSAVVNKMLRVFSKNLRTLHKQTEIILHHEAVNVPPHAAMMLVARSFADVEEYSTARSICELIKKRFPTADNMPEVEQFLSETKNRANREQINVNPLTEDEKKEDESKNFVSSATSAVTLRQFSNPVFDKFTKTYTHRQAIVSEFEPGDSFYLIKKGDVQIVKCINGTKKNLDILHPGEFFGEMAILDSSPRSATCIARGEVECLEFNKENFQALVLNNPTIVFNLLRLFSKRIYDQRRGIRILAIKDISVRVADVFLMFDEATLKPANTDEFDFKRKFPLTVADVAQWVGISTNSARDELNKLVAKKKLDIYDGYIVVANINDMKRTVDQYFASQTA